MVRSKWIDQDNKQCRAQFNRLMVVVLETHILYHTNTPELSFSSFAINSSSGFSARSQKSGLMKCVLACASCVPACQCNRCRAHLSGKGNRWVQWTNYTDVMYSSIFRGNHSLKRCWLQPEKRKEAWPCIIHSISNKACAQCWHERYNNMVLEEHIVSYEVAMKWKSSFPEGQNQSN